MSEKSTINANNIKTFRQAVTTNTVTFSLGIPYKLLWAHVAYTSNATVGNRQIKLAILNAADELLLDNHAGAVQAASLTRHYAFLQGIYRETSFIADELQVPIQQDFYFPANHKLKIYDDTNVSATDTMIVSLQYLIID